ncbi:unnamed protein product [Euphydryas editha]|uniref:Transposase Tc1-like domain-containing protein n=1 Tax=Euphydryas editha TaxID=104508 RepID=A0AAU9VDA8_EUPED|nr:unnamed protein product [Euphydryas editha]
MAKRKQITLEQRSFWVVTYSPPKTGKKEEKKSARLKTTSNEEDNFIRVLFKRNRLLTTPQITAALNDTRETPVLVTTVKRRFLSTGLTGCVGAKKPKLRIRHKKNRLEWAKAHKNWTIDQWENVLWTDESKFQIFESNRQVFVRRSKGERASEACTVPTIKHCGGNVI